MFNILKKLLIPHHPQSTAYETNNADNSQYSYYHKYVADDYELVPFFWDGNKTDNGNKFIEATIYDLFQKNIHPSYMILPHISLNEIFQVHSCYRNRPKLSYKCRSYLATYHVDFLILDRIAGKPIAAIEIDGPWHKENKQQIKNDQFKNSLFRTHNLPLMRFSLEEDILNINFYKQKLDKHIWDLPVYHHRNACYVKMIRRHGKNGMFYSCPSCRRDDGLSQTVGIHFVPDIFV